MSRPPRDYAGQQRDVLQALPGTIPDLVTRTGWCHRIVAETVQRLVKDKRVWMVRQGNTYTYSKRRGRPPKGVKK